MSKNTGTSGTTKDIRLIEYDRVSEVGKRDPKSESFQTIKDARKACKAIVALTPGARIIDRVEALDASGRGVKQENGRRVWPEPKLKEVIARVDAGEADGVVVYNLKRWGRQLPALEVIEHWVDEDKVFLSALDKFDATTPSGRLALRMMMVIASYEWEEGQERRLNSQKNALDRGVYTGRPVEFGLIKDERGKYRLDPNPAPGQRTDTPTWQILHELGEMRADDPFSWTWQELSLWLEKTHGLKREDKRIRYWLLNPIYTGVFHWGGDAANRGHNNKKPTYVREADNDGNLIHDAIFEPDLWERIQATIGERRGSYNSNATHLLAGLKVFSCYCKPPEANSWMEANHSKDYQGDPWPQYSCYRVDERGCKGHNTIGARDTDAWVIAKVIRRIEDGAGTYNGGTTAKEIRAAHQDAVAEQDWMIEHLPRRNPKSAKQLADQEALVDELQKQLDVCSGNRKYGANAAQLLRSPSTPLETKREIVLESGARVTVAKAKRSNPDRLMGIDRLGIEFVQ